MFGKKKYIALTAAALCLIGCAACGEKSEKPKVNESGVTDIITPDKDSEEYGLGSYRISENGVKLYYDESVYPTDLALTMERYFLTFQNDDFDGYKSLIYPDYAERYGAYLEKDYSYGLDGSFGLRRDSLRDIIAGEVMVSMGGDEEPTGDFKVTRIKIEPVEVTEGDTDETIVKSFFSTYDTIFDMDYFDLVNSDVDGFRIFSFYVFAEGEDGKEHALISGDELNQGPRVVFAEKDGKYYTFG